MSGTQHRNRENGLPLLVALAWFVGACSNGAPVFECSDCACEIGTWELLASGDGPSAVPNPPLVSTSDGTLQFGLFSIAPQVRPMPVWRWSGDAWSDITTGDVDLDTSPVNKIFLAAAYHAQADHVVIVGGRGVVPDDDLLTWTFSPADGWMKEDNDAPGSRDLGTAVYHPVEERVLVLGGGPAPALIPEMWAWDGTSWEVSIEGPAPLRQGPGMAYDEARQYVVLFGGRVEDAEAAAGFSYVNDTWIYQDGTWTERSTTTDPGVRAFHAMTYYPDREVTVLIGGTRDGLPNFGSFLDDAWTWDGVDWQAIHVPGQGPTAGSLLTAAYDTARQGVLAHREATLPSGDLEPQTWLFKLVDTDAATGQCCGDGICQFPERNEKRPSQACPADCAF